MKNNNNKSIFRNVFFNFFVLFTAIILSCKDKTNYNVDCSTYDYSECNTAEPFEGRLYIKLTKNSENTSVPITIYSGKFEDNNIFLRDTVTKDNYDTLLPVGNYYSVAAEYKKGSSKIIAVDGGKILKSKTNTCDSVCWTVTTAKVNVRLK